MYYDEKLLNAITLKKSVLCVGLDPDPAHIPESFFEGESEGGGVLKFCKEVIRLTSPYSAAYKINSAYFEAMGPDGFKVMFDVAREIPKECILIADAKRGDVNHTAMKYKTAFFDKLKADAITLNPLMGFDCLEPYSDDHTKCIYALGLTSNPGSSDFFLRPFANRATLSRYIAEALKERQINSDTKLGMVIGATQHDVAKNVLEGYPQAPLLIPGVGAQGGKIRDLITLLQEHEGLPLVTISRAICYPKHKNIDNWRQSVEQCARDFHEQLKPLQTYNA